VGLVHIEFVVCQVLLCLAIVGGEARLSTTLQPHGGWCAQRRGIRGTQDREAKYAGEGGGVAATESQHVSIESKIRLDNEAQLLITIIVVVVVVNNTNSKMMNNMIIMPMSAAHELDHHRRRPCHCC
jgi:hypothetical protein